MGEYSTAKYGRIFSKYRIKRIIQNNYIVILAILLSIQ